MEQGVGDFKNEIQEIRRIVEQNNQMLMSIQRRSQLAIVFSSLKWIVLIGLSFGAFYFLKPYMETALGAYDNIKDMIVK